MAAIGQECQSQNIKEVLLLAKVESTYSDDAIPTESLNAIRAMNASVAILGSEVRREIHKPYWGNDPTVLVNKFVQLTFEVEAAAAGVAGDVPAIGVLLQICGAAETVTPVTKVDYDPASSALDSGTMWFYVGEDLWKLVGARGDFSFGFGGAGQYGKFKFTITGLFQLPANNATIPVPTYLNQATPVPVDFTNTGVATVHGYAAGMHSFDFNAGNKVITRDLPGCYSVAIVGREPSANAVISAPTITTKDFRSIASAGTLGAVLLTHGPATNQVICSLPTAAINLTGVQDQDLGDGDKGIALPFNPLPSTGDDEWLFTFQ